MDGHDAKNGTVSTVIESFQVPGQGLPDINEVYGQWHHDTRKSALS